MVINNISIVRKGIQRYWASVSEPHTSVFNCKFVCAYGVRTYVRTSVRTYAHTAYCFAFQYNVSNSFRNIPNCSRGHGAPVAAVQLA